MALQKAIPDSQYGLSAANGYWKLVQCNIGAADGNSNIVFYGYADKAARDTGKSPIAQKSYIRSGSVFFHDCMEKISDACGPIDANTTVYDIIARICYHIAKTTLDTPVGEAPETGPDTREMVSFFDDATDV